MIKLLMQIINNESKTEDNTIGSETLEHDSTLDKEQTGEQIAEQPPENQVEQETTIKVNHIIVDDHVDCVELGKFCEQVLEGEPVFIIRAKDTYALCSIRAYLEKVKLGKAGNVERVKSAIKSFEQWRKVNKELVKKPT